jgi:hypothetical protein
VFLAAAMWTAVGGGLLFSGARWITGDRLTFDGTGLLLAGVAAGLVKSRLVLDRTAAKILSRIASRGEGRCLGGFLSLRSWLLVLGMILLGRVLRGGVLPTPAVGVLYVAIGTGLIASSRIAWRSWFGGEKGP